jgi:Rrf2 family nitric oxide-sensitive transcriptional repressor
LISQTAEYALRSVVALGRHAEGPLTTQQISEETRIPAGYLSKVLQGLSRAGLVNARRGLHGG